MVVFSKNNLKTKLFGLKKREKVLILVIYDKSIFNANNRKRKIQKKKKKSSLQIKRKRKRIIASEFLIPIRKLCIFDLIYDNQLF